MSKLSIATLMCGAAVLAYPAMAADLGGACCADLEQRVAELEATVARKGNRKVTLTVYGQVNWAIMHTEIDPLGLNETKITNNPNSQTRFGFRGDAKIGPDWSAGYLLEIGTGVAKPMFDYKDGANGVLGEGLNIRHSALYVQSKQLGTVWLGKTSSATDGIAEISIANVANASTLLSLEPLSGVWLGGINMPFDGGRTEVVKWVSPTVGGFTASAAWMGNNNDAWDVALRYAGEFGGFQVAAGIGYRNEDTAYDTGVTTLTGSASVLHTQTGLFVNGAYGKVDGVAANGAIVSGVPFWFVDPEAYHFQAGLERKVFEFGKTTVYGEWGQYEDAMIDKTDFWGLGANQAIDAAAMDLYVGYRRYEDFETSTFVAGGIIRF